MRVLRRVLLTIAIALSVGSTLAAVSPEAGHKKIAPRTFKLGEEPSYMSRAAPEPHDWTPGLTATQNTGAQGLVSSVNFPGVAMGITSYDYQHNGSMHHQIEVDQTNGRVHFSWMYMFFYDCPACQIDRYVAYNYWDPGSDTFTACDLGGFARTIDNPKTVSGVDLHGGYTTIDLTSDGLAVVAFHEADSPGGNYRPNVTIQDGAGQLIFDKFSATNPSGEEHLWPVIDVSTFNDESAIDLDTTDVVHCVTQDFENTDNCAYYRGVYRPSGLPPYIWSAPVIAFTSLTISAVVTEDPNSDKVAMVWAKRIDDQFPPSPNNNDVAILESTTDGAVWIAGANLDPVGTTNITNYNASSEGRAYTDLAAIYDNGGELHVVWNERRINVQTLDYYVNQCKLQHWSPSLGIQTIAPAYYEPGGNSGAWQMNLCKMSISVGSPTATQMCDGETIDDYLYVTYTKFGGESQAEFEDVSAGGFNNGELYWSISHDDGNSWALGVNLSNTKTPDCDTTFANRCASEHWSSIARVVNDRAHIQYIADQDAGGIVQPEGMWTLNPVMYLCIDGDDLCPVIAPYASVTLTSEQFCEYHDAPGGTKSDETLTIENFGNATLTYSISVTDDGAGGGWLSVTPGVGGSIAPGAASDVHTVTMDASSLGEGVYTGNITVTHNDPNKPPFSFDIAFFVMDDFICAEEVVLVTNNSSLKTGSDRVSLAVSNVESFGRENETGGLWRPDTIGYTSNVGEPDTVYGVNPLTDGSLVIARLTNGGADTIAYRDIYSNITPGNPGFLRLTSLAVDTSAYGTGTGAATASAVQTTVDSLIGIDVDYVFPQDQDSSEFVIIKWRITNRTASPITDLLVGSIVDFDLYAQTGLDNKGESNSFYNLVYQVGLDSHAAGFPESANRFSAGISAVLCTPTAGRTEDNTSYVYPYSGVTDQYAYEQIASVGFSDTDSLADIHSIVTLDHDLDLNTADDFGFYCAALVSSVESEADLLNTTKKAWRYCFGWQIVPSEVVIDFDIGEAATIKYVASGTHESGIASGCCGCQVSVVGSPSGITVDTPNDCIGTITIDGNVASPGPITLRVRDLCSEYLDDFPFLVRATCNCPSQGDVAPLAGPGDGDINVLDVVATIDYVFRSGPIVHQDIDCPRSRGDVAPLGSCGEGDVNVLDVVALIDHVFRSGPAPGDPCNCP